MEFTVLVNKSNKLDKSYKPDDLIVVDENIDNFRNYKDVNLKPMVCKVVYDQFLIMKKDMMKLGFEIEVGSAYRSYEYQERLLNDLVLIEGLKEASKKIALPGTSEHQTGLAIDIACYKDGVYQVMRNDSYEEIKWLHKNSYKYGFILRYPKNKENITNFIYEPWHFRYVGIDLAKILFENKLTLEEYYKNSILK